MNNKSCNKNDTVVCIECGLILLKKNSWIGVDKLGKAHYTCENHKNVLFNAVKMKVDYVKEKKQCKDFFS